MPGLFRYTIAASDATFTGTMKPLLAFVVGLLGGAVIMFAIKPDRAGEVSASQAEAAAAVRRLAEANESLSRTQAEADTLRKELRDAHSAIEAAAKTTVAAAPATPQADAASGSEGARQFAEMIKSIGQSQMKAQIEAKVTQLRERLKLTPDQDARLKELVTARTEEMSKALLNMVDGKGEAGDFAKVVRFQRGDLPAEIVNLFTPAQQAEYAQFQQDDRANRIEMRANAELLGLQAAGGLSGEQKDAAFGKLSELAAAEEDINVDALTTPDEIRTFVNDAITNRLDAMRPLLTDPQMQSYESQVEMHRQMMSKLMPGIFDSKETR
jgi:hypothetical protein